jgi:hypothetical protein
VDGVLDYYKANILSTADYYAFGMIMPGRTYTSSTGYRYGFGGQEMDDEISGNGNSYTAEYWEYYSRLGRRWNLDPITKPWESRYATFGDNPIYYTDPNGLDKGTATKKEAENGAAQNKDATYSTDGNTRTVGGTTQTLDPNCDCYLGSSGSSTGTSGEGTVTTTGTATTTTPTTTTATTAAQDVPARVAAPTRVIAQNPNNRLKITYGANANSTYVSQRTINVLNEIANRAGITSITITSTIRTPHDQARIMYGNIEKYGVAKQKKLYADAGDKVIDAYSSAKLRNLTSDEIIAIMEAKILAIGPGKISKHTADPNVLNVVDISAGSVLHPAAFINAVNTSTGVSKFLQPPTDPAYHLEIPQR